MRGIGVCGDGCLGGRVESAWLSARAVAAASAY
jgi:predicted NAD/FAD-dependent oxidoreductase